MAKRNETVRAAIHRWRTDYDYKTFVNSAASTFITIAFALYNGYLGFWHLSPWYGCICVYYSLLAFLRVIIVQAERKADRQRKPNLRKKTHMIAAIILLTLNICLIGPIYLMVKQVKPVSLSMIPAIAMAAYTTYKITMAAVNLKRKNRSGNLLVRLLRTINFIDALQSIVVLQNTLIMVNGKGDISRMIPFTAITSAVIWVDIVVISIAVLVKSWRANAI